MKQKNIISKKRQYNIKNLKFYYQEENDLLYIYKEGTKVYSNIILGDFHIEITKQGDIVGIEITNASSALEEYGLPPNVLKNLQQVQIKISENQNTLVLWLTIAGKEGEQSIPLTINNRSSPIAKLMQME